jgi:tRNA nucleotidyltransferase (CCA-adding enzyme)
MSDYMFMLESHLNAEQNRVLAEVQSCAADLNVSVFLTGGAMRDMLAGFPIRDLDFTVEGPAPKLAKAIAQKTGAEILSVDETRKTVEMRFGGGVNAEIGMARQERYTKPGSKPHVQAATIHDDLRGRDFTVNAIALSLNRASRGLLIDPTNGLADIGLREIRAAYNFSLYDDPSRMLRLMRFKVRLGYTIAERTQRQYQNAREAGLEAKITPQALASELRNIADEPGAGDILKLLDDEKLLPLFSPALEGAKLNLPGFAKLQKARQMVPFGADFPVTNIGLFLHLVMEKLSPKERTAFIKQSGLEKEDISAWQKLEPAAKKLEKDLKGSSLQKPSKLYSLLQKAPGEQMLYLMIKSSERIVHDRIKNYLQKYLPAALEVNDRDVTAATDLEPGHPKFAKARQEIIAKRLDARPKKIVVPGEEEQEAGATPAPTPAPAAAPAPGSGPGRGTRLASSR